jgi:hypothetical protein
VAVCVLHCITGDNFWGYGRRSAGDAPVVTKVVCNGTRIPSRHKWDHRTGQYPKPF